MHLIDLKILNLIKKLKRKLQNLEGFQSTLGNNFQFLEIPSNISFRSSWNLETKFLLRINIGFLKQEN